MSDGRPVCYLSMPSYGSLTAGAARGFFRATRGVGIDVQLLYEQSSLLACNFNQHWCRVLNAEASGQKVSYFAMLHADVQAEDFWLDKLIAELERSELDVLSVVVPIKDNHGLTSTAIAHESGDPWRVLGRLTMREIYKLPETFTAADCGHPDKALLVNTGCWVCRWGEWCQPPFHFEIDDRIAFDPVRNRYVPQVRPEDWNASRQFHSLGLRVGATRKVQLIHAGNMNFPNNKPWGDYHFDREYRQQSIIECPATELDGWRMPADVAGWLTEDEGRELGRLAAGKRVLEIGSFCGRSTICMAQTATSVVCIDPFDGRATPNPGGTRQQLVENLIRYGVSAKVTPEQGTTDEVAPQLADDFDLAFIDGAHDYENVANDIRWAQRLLRPGGLIAFHDYQRECDPGVTRAVREILAGGAELLAVTDTLAVVKPAAAALALA